MHALDENQRRTQDLTQEKKKHAWNKKKELFYTYSTAWPHSLFLAGRLNIQGGEREKEEEEAQAKKVWGQFGSWRSIGKAAGTMQRARKKELKKSSKKEEELA